MLNVINCHSKLTAQKIIRRNNTNETASISVFKVAFIFGGLDRELTNFHIKSKKHNH